jgi:regulator of replication initiation timing
MPIRTSQSSLWIFALCLCFTTGCAFSKNLLGKSKLAPPALPAQTTANPDMAKADCAAPPMSPRANELTALPVVPTPASQPVANVAPATNGTPQPPVQQPVTQQQPIVPQQPVVQQQPSLPQPGVLTAVPQQTAAALQQPVQQQTLQQGAQAMPPAADFAAATQAQGQAPQTVPAAVTPAPEQSQVMIPGLPPATVQAGVPGSKVVSVPDLSATPASALRAQSHSGTAPTVVCPPGMVPTYGYMTDAVSPPEKMAECEKQVHEMNQKLTELQFDTMKARQTMEQMAEQQKQLLLDNERLRRRAEMADQRYLEELDSLSEIVGDVVSQAGTANKSNSTAKPSRGANPLRPVPQSAAGQSL